MYLALKPSTGIDRGTLPAQFWKHMQQPQPEKPMRARGLEVTGAGILVTLLDKPPKAVEVREVKPVL